jgi:single-stranded-DNA-specific exonuclease
MVPLIGENRVLAKFGLMVLRKSPRLGLNALFYALRINKRFLSEDDIVFSISPRLNAASRMGDPMDAFRLLTTNDEVEAVQLAKTLERLNKERKGVVAGVIKEIRHIINDRGLAEKGAIVVGNPNWKPPILGLVAGNIAEEFNLPVFLWGRDTETIFKGSCRGGGGINVLELMEKASNIFIEYGGHAGAGGFSVSFENVHRLEDELLKVVSDCKKEIENKSVLADVLFRLDDVNREVFSELNKLAPFGEGNPKPIFLIGQALIEGVRRFGRENSHTAIRFAFGDKNFIEAISFFNTPEDFAQSILPGERISLLAHIEQSNFNGNSEIRLRIKDILS